MSSSMLQVSSGTEGETRYEVIDEKKKRRMISNRESAKRSRMRKQKHLEDLIKEIDILKKHNKELVGNINEISQRYRPTETENNVLAAQKMELEERLRYLNAILSNNVERNLGGRDVAAGIGNNGGITQASEGYQGFDGFVMDGPDPLLRPWQSCCTSQPIMASASMFQF